MKYTNEQLKDMALNEALQNFLSGMDETLSNQEILEAVQSEDFDKVTFWEPMNAIGGEELANVIEACSNGIFRLLKTVSNGE